MGYIKDKSLCKGFIDTKTITLLALNGYLKRKVVKMYKTNIEKGYDNWSVNYDTFDNPMIAMDERYFPECIHEIQGLKVLDLGCGSGRYSFRLAQNGAIVTGIDLSEGMLEKAQSKNKDGNVTFIKHDIQQNLPFDNDTFDIIIASLVFEHIVCLKDIFAEVKRVLKINGKFLFSEMHPAMFYKNIQAHYFDEDTQKEVLIGSYKRQLSDFINPLLELKFTIEKISEHCCDEELVKILPKAKKHLHYPMIFIMQLKK